MEILNTITKGMAWFIIGWHVLSFMAVGIILAWERFTRPPEPTADEINAEADTYEAQHGKAACQQIGKDMYDERSSNRSGDGRRYRFLRAVSGELVRRMIERSERASATATEISSPYTRATGWPAAAPKP